VRSRPETTAQAPAVASPSTTPTIPPAGPSSSSYVEKAASSDKPVGAWNKVVGGNQPPALSTPSLAPAGLLPPEPHVGVALGASQDCLALAESLNKSRISGMVILSLWL